MPWVAPEQGVCLHRCKDTRCSALKKYCTPVNMIIQQVFGTQRREQGMQHLIIVV
jgi:hypothetical protein